MRGGGVSNVSVTADITFGRISKLMPHHLERLAAVYVRQSSLQQVTDHQESTRLQYALADHAVALGWPRERVLIIDDDLGKSGAHAEGRPGFQQLVAEVGLNHVGLILGIEMSRLARSNKDWHQLLEVCALFRTLIADQDGMYDPADYNDRLLLGLKGTMSEAELHVLKQRLHQGKLSKAKRGELRLSPPIGYARRPSGEIGFDPDEQVQQVVRLIFRKFEELGSINALLRYVVAQKIHIGMRERCGAVKGELSWREPNRMTLRDILKHPMYAGAYVYGRRQSDPRKQKPNRRSTGRVIVAARDWHVLIKDHVPAYITWEQFERNQARIEQNLSWAGRKGAVREGPALLSGLLVCGHCGSRMVVSYSGKDYYRYTCVRQQLDYGLERCQGLTGSVLDAFIRDKLLAALEPAALALSLVAAEQVEHERSELDDLWQRRLERVAFEVDRASRHYRLIEPENRLVARQLAKEWEVKLAEKQQLEEDYRRFLQEQPRLLSAQERESITQLAYDLPALWDAATTKPAERKEIVRQLVEQVVVEVESESERVRIAITWAGGYISEGVALRPVNRLAQLSNYPALCARVRALANDGLGAEKIANNLHQEGFRPPKRYSRFGRQGVTDLLHQLGIYRRKSARMARQQLAEDEWYLPDLTAALGMGRCTLLTWIRRGWVCAYQQPQPSRRWVIRADQAEFTRLKRLHQQTSRHKKPLEFPFPRSGNL